MNCFYHSNTPAVATCRDCITEMVMYEENNRK